MISNIFSALFLFAKSERDDSTLSITDKSPKAIIFLPGMTTYISKNWATGLLDRLAELN